MLDRFQVLSEGEAKTREQWIDLLGYSGAFAELLERGILRRSASLQSKRSYTLNYVGVLAFGGEVWFAFPKVTASKEISSARLIIKSIDEYRRRVTKSVRPHAFSDGTTELYGATIIEGFSGLLGWTLERGFHERSIVDTSASLDSIDWARTVNGTLPLHTSGSVIYAEPITRKPMTVVSELAEVQAYALLDYRKKLGDLADLFAPNSEQVWDDCRSILSHGSVSMQSEVISSILIDFGEASNRDEDVEILRLLWAWYNDQWNGGAKAFQFGVSSFHTVWEDMCGVALQCFGIPIEHAVVASQPRYDVGGSQFSLPSQRPDILRMVSDRGLLIADAKWYSIDKGALPGTPDAVKQFVYEASIDPSFCVVLNCLMFPSESGMLWDDAGSLEMERNMAQDVRFPPIRLLRLDWRNLAEHYVKRQGLPEVFSNWLTDCIDDSAGLDHLRA
jgi:hypothetical protein